MVGGYVCINDYAQNPLSCIYAFPPTHQTTHALLHPRTQAADPAPSSGPASTTKTPTKPVSDTLHPARDNKPRIKERAGACITPQPTLRRPGHTPERAYKRAYIHACMHMHTRSRAHIHAHTCSHTHKRIYAQTHTNTHKRPLIHTRRSASAASSAITSKRRGPRRAW